jgi:alpha-L-fucosidase
MEEIEMSQNLISRRDWVKLTGAAPVVAASLTTACSHEHAAAKTVQEDPRVTADRVRRMQWWHDAKFGMFIHFGLFSVLGKDVWNYESEGWTMSDYEPLVKQFNPKPGSPLEWAKLARRAGQKYMVLTTKNHDGFCLWDTKTTKYSAAHAACGRDIISEYVEAARSQGLRVGYYFSLFDWHHPDGERCLTDPAARERFVSYTHEQIRELLSNYGKIDILWYDGARPSLGPDGWQSVKMNEMVFRLQPDIIVNDRNGLKGDFSTPEQRISAEEGERAWESCMTLNQSWGYHAADDEWKPPKTILRNLVTCARDNGNYLVSIGPRADGSVQKEAIDLLSKVGEWMDRNCESIYGTRTSKVNRFEYAGITRKGNTLFLHVHAWPGKEIQIGAIVTKARSARFLATGKPIQFDQNSNRLRFHDIPATAPDHPTTVIAVEFDSEPVQDMLAHRRTIPRTAV